MGEEETAIGGREPRNAGIDLLRLVAALAVVAFHLGLSLPRWAGLQVFFVMSGYLITWSIESRPGGTARARILGFYERRARRLVPGLWIYLLLAAPYVFLSGRVPVDGWWAAFTFTSDIHRAFQPHEHSYVYSHFWPLGVMARFYLLYAPLLVLRPRWTTPVFLAALAVGPVARQVFPDWSSAPDMLLNNVDAFAAGALLRLHLGRLKGYATLAAIAGMVLLLALIEHFAAANAAVARFNGLFGYSLTLVLGLLLIAWFAGRAMQGALWRRLSGLGVYIYEIYVLHYPMLRMVRLAVPDDLPLHGLAVAVLSFATILPAAMLLHRITRPFREVSPR